MIGIYCIENLITHEKYVGQSTNIKQRWEDHRKPSRLSYSTPLYRAFREYGIDNFKFSVLEECDVSKLDEREIYWIKKCDSYDHGYNSTTGGKTGTCSKSRNRIPNNFGAISVKNDVAPIVKLDKSFNVLSIYPSVSECARQNGVNSSSISKVAKGKRKTCKNNIYMYYKDIMSLTKEGIKLLRDIQIGKYDYA